MLVVKRRNREINLYDKKIEDLIFTFIEKKGEVDKLNKILNSLKEDIIKVANEHKESEKSVQLFLNKSGVKITFNDELKIVDSKKLQELLGDNFTSFVKEEFKAKLGLRTLFKTNGEIKECLELNIKKPIVTLVRI